MRLIHYLCGFMLKIKIWLILGLALVLTSCNQYNRLLKSTNYPLKFSKAKEFYNKKQYLKADPLFDELLTVFRGTENQEDAYYYYAYNQFYLKNYDFAAFHFKNFVINFPYSAKVEEMEFMYAYCMYNESPTYSLDPNPTQKAIEAVQLFVTHYPNSAKIEQCNELLDELRGKLQKKSLEIGLLFFKMEDYRAAVVALRNTLSEFPDVANREEIKFLIVKSSYLLAENSVESKKEQRIEDTFKAITDFTDEYPQSKWTAQVLAYKSNTDELKAKEIKKKLEKDS